MALYRQIHVNFWDDPFIEELAPLEKYFYLYLMTNARTTQCGIYEITEKKMSDETRLSINDIKEFIFRLEHKDKIIYDRDTHELMMLNWIKYNLPKSIKIVICVMKEMLNVKNKQFIRRYISLCDMYGCSLQNETYSIDTLFLNDTEEQNKNKNIIRTEEEEEEDYVEPSEPITKIPYQKIVDLYHQHCPSLSKLQVISDKRKKQIKAVWKKFEDINKQSENPPDVIDIFIQVFQKVEASNFLTGRDGKWANCSFDWIIILNNFIKIYEGQYDLKNNKKTMGW